MVGVDRTGLAGSGGTPLTGFVGLLGGVAGLLIKLAKLVCGFGNGVGKAELPVIADSTAPRAALRFDGRVVMNGLPPVIFGLEIGGGN